MVRVNKWVRRFSRLPMLVQCTLVVGVALVATECLTLLFYSIYFSDRLLLDLFLSAMIVLLVGYPLAYVFLRQGVKLVSITEELERVSRIDDLTQLENRKTFFWQARDLIAQSEGKESAGALMFIDVDHFKTLNDTWGHHTGDAVLRRIGDAIKLSVRSSDITGRLGGEEFAIFLPGGDKENARQVGERIRERIGVIARELGLNGRTITVSVGVAVHEPGEELEDVLRSADSSLYAAKARGRNQIVYFPGSGLAA